MTTGSKKKGIPEDSPLQWLLFFGDPWFKTMVIISDYELEYNEKSDIFSKEQ